MARRLPNTSKKRFNLVVSQVTNQKLEELKISTDADSISEVIRRAVRIYDHMHKEEVQVFIRHKDGTEKEIMFF